MKDSDILFLGDKWVIAVNIAFDDYVSLIGAMRLVIGQVSHNIQVHRNPRESVFDVHWEEINRLERVNEEPEND